MPMAYAVLAYVFWGFFAAFFPLLNPASPLEILAHRIVWTAVFMVAVIWYSGTLRQLRAASRRTWLIIAVAATVIAINWLTYVIAVNSGHVAEAALGYFINPLVNVLLGMVFLGERLRALQKLSVGIAAAAVLLLTFAGGEPPILGLILAFSFGFYGLIKKRVNMSVSASLTAETLALFPAAAAFLAYLEFTATSSFLQHGWGHTLLLVSTGVVTAIPLLCFGMGAKLVPLSTLGMLQYMTPTVQMLWAVFIVHEHLTPMRWVGFVIIWVSVSVYLLDLALHRAPRR
ncbi:EamA-like transporter family protein [Corynebacterium canis]|nr:EamA-like transporter family protein [Corynebacterium canis]